MKVYLAGPINGRTDADCKDWRTIAKQLLWPISTLDPMDRDYRGRELEPGISREIVFNDMKDIENSDALLVYFDKPSVGTSMEVFYAHFNLKKFIVVVNVSGKPISPWMMEHSSHVVNTLEDGVTLLKAHLLPSSI